jgi:hypothetical protein
MYEYMGWEPKGPQLNLYSEEFFFRTKRIYRRPNPKKRSYLPHNPEQTNFPASFLFFHILNLPFGRHCFMFETILIFLGIYSGVPCLILTELLLDTAVATSHPSTAREKIIAKNFYVLFLSLHKI